MSDIDFVELDKAVNNLVNKNNVKSDATAVQPVTQPTKPSNQVSHKPAGRFMDVFHHSSDMMGKNNDVADKTDSSSASLPRKVLNPIYNDIKTSPKPSELPEPSSIITDESLRKNDWPDPIDTGANKPENSFHEEPTKETPLPPVDTSSLFLPDTKVEKRPLGGFNAENIENNKDDEDKEKQLETNPPSPVNVAPSAELPPELEADLVAIEEGGSTFSTTASLEGKEGGTTETSPNFLEGKENKPGGPTVREDLSQPSSPAVKHDPLSEPVTVPPQKAELSGLLAAGSIPQQYKAAAVTNDHSPESTHPIFFDADQYNKAPDPGAHTTSGKTSVFQWIFIIVGLLLLGATLGAALFVFVSNN